MACEHVRGLEVSEGIGHGSADAHLDDNKSDLYVPWVCLVRHGFPDMGIYGPVLVLDHTYSSLREYPGALSELMVQSFDLVRDAVADFEVLKHNLDHDDETSFAESPGVHDL